MQVSQEYCTPPAGWQSVSAARLEAPQLVLAFGSRRAFAEGFDALRQRYAGAALLSATTAGEIADTAVHDDTLTVTALRFAHTTLKTAAVQIADFGDSHAAGQALGAQLNTPELAYVLVISDGLRVNGSQLAAGLHAAVSVPVTGGLAGDGAAFAQTLTGIDTAPGEGIITAVGFYGQRLRVGHGSVGGWDSFGPERRITKAAGNVLYELDGQSALALYKTYLDDEAAGLPGTGLLFPLSVKAADRKHSVVRTLLAVDEGAGSMTFAGDMPEGAIAQLMKANFERLIDGAGEAAEYSLAPLSGTSPDFALCISCVGRKLVLGQRVEEEVEEVRAILGDRPVISGFYSYGEISPFTPGARCQLHNQTMTVTTLAEV